MERFFIFCYNKGHETPWNPSRTGKAPATSHRIAEARQSESIGGGALDGSIEKFSLPMVPSVSEGRLQGSPVQGDSWTSSEVVGGSKNETGATVVERSLGGRISDRSLDPETDCPGDPETVWHSVSPQPCLEIAFRDGVELPEARASRVTKERRGD